MVCILRLPHTRLEGQFNSKIWESPEAIWQRRSREQNDEEDPEEIDEDKMSKQCP
jgi:hypothetical protein